jgi:hypothetical protein
MNFIAALVEWKYDGEEFSQAHTLTYILTQWDEWPLPIDIAKFLVEEKTDLLALSTQTLFKGEMEKLEGKCYRIMWVMDADKDDDIKELMNQVQEWLKISKESKDA